jgi:hypothetical protein
VEVEKAEPSKPDLIQLMESELILKFGGKPPRTDGMRDEQWEALIASSYLQNLMHKSGLYTPSEEEMFVEINDCIRR